jgi:hypothetical protein
MFPVCDDILLEVSHYLHLSDLICLQSVSHDYKRIIEDPYSWFKIELSLQHIPLDNNTFFNTRPYLTAVRCISFNDIRHFKLKEYQLIQQNFYRLLSYHAGDIQHFFDSYPELPGWMYSAYIQNQVLTCISKMISLQTLHLYCFSINLSCLETLNNLYELQLYDCQIPVILLEQSLKQLPLLINIGLWYIERLILPGTLSAVVKSCGNRLLSFDILGATLAEPNEIELMQQMPKLNRLRWTIGDGALIEVGNVFKSMQLIELTIEDENVEWELSSNIPQRTLFDNLISCGSTLQSLSLHLHMGHAGLMKENAFSALKNVIGLRELALYYMGTTLTLPPHIILQLSALTSLRSLLLKGMNDELIQQLFEETTVITHLQTLVLCSASSQPFTINIMMSWLPKLPENVVEIVIERLKWCQSQNEITAELKLRIMHAIPWPETIPDEMNCMLRNQRRRMSIRFETQNSIQHLGL